MIRKTSTLLLTASAVFILPFSSCRKDRNQEFAESGLRANRIYYCDTVSHTGPIRMFTQAGEVTDSMVISGYLSLRPFIAGAPEAMSEQHPYYIQSLATTEARLNGLQIFRAMVTGEAFDMQQQDTAKSGWGTGGSGASNETSYNYTRRFRAVRDAILEMNGSFSKLERVDSTYYRSFESFRLKGRYTNEVIELPYTFLASEINFESYPFPLKSNPSFQVAAGDTLLMQEGKVEFRLRP